MRVYIAASLPDRADAAALAVALRERGHEVTSKWHDDERATVEHEAGMSAAVRVATAHGNLRDISNSGTFVLLNERANDRHGKWIELGYASHHCHVVVVGECPIPLMAESVIGDEYPNVAAFLEGIR